MAFAGVVSAYENSDRNAAAAVLAREAIYVKKLGMLAPGLAMPLSRRSRDSTSLDRGDVAVRGPAETMLRRGELSSLPVPPVDAGRAVQLRTVVRLKSFSTGQEFCTGTIVSTDFGAKILTAAHCMYIIDAHDVIGERRASFVVEIASAANRSGNAPLVISVNCSSAVGALGAGSMASPCFISRSFKSCAEKGIATETISAVQCVSRGAQDVALISLREPDVYYPQWSVCRAAPAGLKVAIFGYGLNGVTSPLDLLEGAFQMKASAPGKVWTASGTVINASSLRQRVAPGDSGGPVISASDDKKLSSEAAQVCFVVSSLDRRSDASDPVLNESYAWLQPIWNLKERMTMSVAELTAFYGVQGCRVESCAPVAVLESRDIAAQ